MINYIMAHAEEVHETAIETTAHELAWYVQLPSFIIFITIFTYIVWLITKKKDTTLLITSAILLIAGFGLFQIAPVVSALSITVGLISTLLITLLGLGFPDKK